VYITQCTLEYDTVCVLVIDSWCMCDVTGMIVVPSS